MWEVLETARNVAEKGRSVWIDEQTLCGFSGKLAAHGTPVPQWDSSVHFFDNGEDTVSYFLILDSLNFCFWPEAGKERWEIEHESRRLSGYNALAACLKRTVESGIPITKAEYLADLTLSGLRRILGGRGELQLLENRLKALNELGNILLRDYNGQGIHMVQAAENSALALARLLAEKFMSYRDIAEYQGDTVFFYKRAQIIAADLHGAFKGEKWGRFADMDRITAFADYKLPQVLRHLGILHYRASLAQKVDQKILLEAGSAEEVEIRANTIWAVELIRQELNRRGTELRAYEIDWILWNLGQQDKFRKRPYHRTVTVFY